MKTRGVCFAFLTGGMLLVAASAAQVPPDTPETGAATGTSTSTSTGTGTATSTAASATVASENPPWLQPSPPAGPPAAGPPPAAPTQPSPYPAPVAPPYGAYPAAPAAYPYGPGPYPGWTYPERPLREPRSGWAIAGGILSITVGVMGITGGGAVFGAGSERVLVFCEDAQAGIYECQRRDDGAYQAVGAIMMVGGGLFVVAGIPLIIWGAQKVPKDTATGEDAPEPSAGALRLTPGAFALEGSF